MDTAAAVAVGLALAAALAWLAWEVRTLHRDALPLIRLAESPTVLALSGLARSSQ